MAKPGTFTNRPLARPLAAALAVAGPILSCGSPSGGASENGAREPAPARSGSARESAADREARMAWWREARFGMFVHWGLYAIPAGKWGESTGHGEWIRETAHIPVGDYEQFLPMFNPVHFDAGEWARMAKNAGMGYVVITSKHHDGFCLFDSAATDWDVMSTPFRRDIMAELAGACADEGLRMCWYHSIMDWHHPDYLPRRGWEEAARPAAGADFDRFEGYLQRQVTELLTNYGPIGVMWFDGEWESTWTHERGVELYELCRRLQPHVIVNNRVDVARGGMAGFSSRPDAVGDFATPEQEIPATGMPGVDWETCMTMNDHWGYNAWDKEFKSTADLVRKLCDIASKGGNFLLNVGPEADGTFPEESVQRLAEIGAWMKVNGEAIRGTSASPFPALDWGRCTQKPGARGTTLYLLVFDWPSDGRLVVPGLGNQVGEVRLLGRPAARCTNRRSGDDVLLGLPLDAPSPICSVVELEIDGRPIVYGPPAIEADAEIFVSHLPLEVRPFSPGLEVRATLDGSTPTIESEPIAGTIVLTESARVTARSFHGGRAVGTTAARSFMKVDPWPAVGGGSERAGLRAMTYRGDWNRLPDFGALQPETSAAVSALGLHPEIGEHVGLRFDGFLVVPEDQAYVLALDSDDGSKLWIDGQLAVDNDGLHGALERRAVLPLAAGAHALRVDWFNKTGGASLGLRWASIGGELEPVPASAFRLPQGP
jgi:alpha-L-fucosidase